MLILSKLFKLSVFPVPHLQNGDKMFFSFS